jgi:hypothetical protein
MFARALIRFSPFFFIIFMAIPIAFAGVAASGGFELDTTMDAFTIRDHPAAAGLYNSNAVCCRIA